VEKESDTISYISELFNGRYSLMRCNAHSTNTIVKCLHGALRAPDLTCEYLDDDLDDTADGADIPEIGVDSEGFLFLEDKVIGNSLDSPVSAVRDLLKVLKYSPKMRSMFDSEAALEQKRYAIPLDVPTRWSSTYKMLQFACTHQKQLKAFLKNVTDISYQGEESTCMKYKLSMSEIRSTLTKKAWDDIKIITRILGFFARLTTAFSEAKANSENVLLSFYHIDDFLTNLLEVGTKAHEKVTEKNNLKEINGGILPMSIRKAVDAARDKASEYYNFADQLDFTFICSILDPRSKDRVIKRNLGDHLTVTEIVQGVEDNLVRYYNCLSEEPEVIQDSGCIEEADDDEVDLFTEMLQEQFSDIGSPPTSADSVVQEFRRYLAEDRLQMANFDILK
jgi:hypothetical protein